MKASKAAQAAGALILLPFAVLFLVVCVYVAIVIAIAELLIEYARRCR